MITNSEVIVLDFETTGLSAGYDRIIEVGAAVVNNDGVTETFATLCNPGVNIPYFISDITGITAAMIKGKPKPEDIMPELKAFIGNRPILAHNASFDAQFLQSEISRAKINIDNPFLCTMLLARRIIQDVTNYQLGTLKRHIKYRAEPGHKDHRALDDVKTTAALWLYLRKEVETITGGKNLDITLYQKITKMPKNQVVSRLGKIKAEQSFKCEHHKR